MFLQGATSHIAPTVSPDPPKYMAYLADPEGNLIEVVERNCTAGRPARHTINDPACRPTQHVSYKEEP